MESQGYAPFRMNMLVTRLLILRTIMVGMLHILMNSNDKLFIYSEGKSAIVCLPNIELAQSLPSYAFFVNLYIQYL